jgi:hypothetical protein
MKSIKTFFTGLWFLLFGSTRVKLPMDTSVNKRESMLLKRNRDISNMLVGLIRGDTKLRFIERNLEGYILIVDLWCKEKSLYSFPFPLKGVSPNEILFEQTLTKQDWSEIIIALALKNLYLVGSAEEYKSKPDHRIKGE